MKSTITLPIIGLGTWQLNGSECEKAVQMALKIGYRHIDTADIYGNHREIGKVIQSWPREELFLTTKLYINDLTPERVFEAVPRFLKELNVDYFDLLLIHWPNREVNMIDTLKAMLHLKERGVVRFIGVSNFMRSHLKAIAPYRFPILTNQIELHPYLQRKPLVEACKKMGITITAYRPLAKGAFEADPVLQKIGKKYGRSPSQIALRWLVQQEFCVIPKASSRQHLKDNFEIFDFVLSADDMKAIQSLDQGKKFCSPEGLDVEED